MTDKFKTENKRKTKPAEDRAVPYTATMPYKYLKALDEQPGDRSANILKAVRSFYMIG